MKKLISILFTLLLLLVAFPINSNAVVNKSNIERIELIDLACLTFPEYASNIRGNANKSYRGPQNGPAEIVFCETRAISENERITFAQYSNNRGVIVYETASAASLEETGSSENTFCCGLSSTLSYAITPTLESDFSGVFYLDNFKYRLISATYDSITDDGTPSYNDEIYCAYTQSTTVYQETATSAAKATYNITFIHNGSYGVFSSDDIYVTLDLRVRNDTVTVHLR